MTAPITNTVVSGGKSYTQTFTPGVGWGNTVVSNAPSTPAPASKPASNVSSTRGANESILIIKDSRTGQPVSGQNTAIAYNTALAASGGTPQSILGEGKTIAAPTPQELETYNATQPVSINPSQINEKILNKALNQPTQVVNQSFGQMVSGQGINTNTFNTAKLALLKPANQRTLQEKLAIQNAASISGNYAAQMTAHNVLIQSEINSEAARQNAARVNAIKVANATAEANQGITPQSLRQRGEQINPLQNAATAFTQSILESKREGFTIAPTQSNSILNLIIGSARADSAAFSAFFGSLGEQSYYFDTSHQLQVANKGGKLNAYGQESNNPYLDNIYKTFGATTFFSSTVVPKKENFSAKNVSEGAQGAYITTELVANTVPYFVPVAGQIKAGFDVFSAKTPEEAAFAVVGGLGTAGVIKVFAKSGEALPLFINTKLGKSVASAVMVAGEEGTRGIKYTSKLANVVSAGQRLTSNYGLPAIGYGMVGFEAMELNAAPTRAQLKQQIADVRNSSGQIWTDATGKVISQDEAIKLIESTPTKEEIIRSGNVAFAGFTIGGALGGIIGGQLGKPLGKYAFRQTVLQGASPYGQLDASQKELFNFLYNVGETKIPGSLKPTGEPSITRLAAVEKMSSSQASRAVNILETSTTKYGAGNKLQGSTIFEAFGVDLKRPLGDRDYAQATREFVTDVYGQAKQQHVAPRGTRAVYEENLQQDILKYHTSFGTRTRISNAEYAKEQNIFDQLKDFVTGKNNAPKYKTNVAYEFINAGSNADMYTRFYNNQNIGSILETPGRSFVKTPAGQEVLGLKYNFQEKLYGGYIGGRAKDITDIMAVVGQKPEFGVLPKGAKAPVIPKAPKIELQTASKGNGIFGSFFEARANKANQAKQDALWKSFTQPQTTYSTSENTNNFFKMRNKNSVVDSAFKTKVINKDYSYVPKKGYNIQNYIFSKTETYYPKSTRTPTPTVSPTISSLIYGTKTSTPTPRPTGTPSIVPTVTPSITPYVYSPTPTPTPSKTPTPTPYPYTPYYYAPPKRVPKGIPLGGSGGAGQGGSAHREKRVYYNELEQVLKLIGGSEPNKISPAGKGGFRNKGIKGILSLM